MFYERILLSLKWVKTQFNFIIVVFVGAPWAESFKSELAKISELRIQKMGY